MLNVQIILLYPVVSSVLLYVYIFRVFLNLNCFYFQLNIWCDYAQAIGKVVQTIEVLEQDFSHREDKTAEQFQYFLRIYHFRDFVVFGVQFSLECKYPGTEAIYIPIVNCLKKNISNQTKIILFYAMDSIIKDALLFK